MELNKKLLADIAEIFKGVKYGRISFFLSPEKKTLDYTIETTGKLLINQVNQDKAGIPWPNPLTTIAK
jgi:hypothetical protein